ncbi:ANK [Seminavis robusta]|uniref:ANK n=1 Tax=Seminavis robusta TaxID=568900 RepID=A0A9N8E0K9_9STRA|nr:ANK [Seminavis robusta]|eukprot:Sro430_g141280.1 ANK (1091) ;mRNA; r:22871-26143
MNPSSSDFEMKRREVESNVHILEGLGEGGNNVSAVFAEVHGGGTPLNEACRRGGLQEVQELLWLLDTDVNAASEHGQTPLHCAAAGGFREIVILLLENGGNARAANVLGETPLHLAALNGHIQVAKVLLEQGGASSKATKRRDGQTPLHYCSYRGHVKMAMLLHFHGADLDCQAHSGLTPWDIAKIRGRRQLRTYLEQTILGEEYLLELQTAVKAGHIFKLKTSLPQGETFVNCGDHENNTLLHIAVLANGTTEMAALLLKHGADLEQENEEGLTPLDLARQSNMHDLISFLQNPPSEDSSMDSSYRMVDLRPQVPVNESMARSLLKFAEDGNLRDVVALVKSGIDPSWATSDTGESPLHMACKNGHAPVVQRLLDEGANPNAQTTVRGETPLHLAVQNGSLAIVAMLLEKGADWTILDSEERDAVELARCREKTAIQDFFEERGVGTDTEQGVGSTEDATTGEHPWACSVCTFAENPETYLSCSVCQASRPLSATPNEKQWVCATCTFANPGGANNCVLCCAPRTSDEAHTEDNDKDESKRTDLSKHTIFQHAVYKEARGTITINSMGVGFEETETTKHHSWFWEDIVSLESADGRELLQIMTEDNGKHVIKTSSADHYVIVEEATRRRSEFRVTLSRRLPTVTDNEELTCPRICNVACAERPEFLGVSVHHLENVFMAEVTMTPCLSKKSKFYEIEDLRAGSGFVREKGADVICPVDGKRGAAYVHCLEGSDHVGCATHMLSWTWSYTVQDVVETLVGFCEQNRLDPRKTYIWICCLCMNQHRVAEARDTSTDDFEKAFRGRVQGIGRILVMMTPWGDPANLQRIWCIFEIFWAIKEGCHLAVIMPPRDMDRMLVQLFSTWGRRLGERGIDNLYKALNQIDVEKADASVPEDKTRILELVRGSIGFQSLNVQVKGRLRHWVREVIEQRSTQTLEALDDDNAADRLSHAVFCKQVGDLFDLYGDSEAALTMYRQCLATREKLLVPSRLETAKAYTDVARALASLGRIDEAAELYWKAKVVHEEVLGEDHVETAEVYSHLGRLLTEMNDVDNALQLMQRCQDVQEKKFGRSRIVAVTSCRLGLLYSQNGK